jgi:uncharacterized protein
MAAMLLMLAAGSVAAQSTEKPPAPSASAPAAAQSAEDAYRKGQDFEKKQNYAEAMRWYRLAAAQGVSEAQTDVGFFYMVGWGVAIDYAEGMRWSRKAADQGNEVAQRNIGYMYFKGLGVAPDRAEAVRWFRKAAAQGDEDAIEGLKELGEK